MADQFHDSVPLAANQILADLSDMDEMFGYFKTVISNFIGTWSDSTATGIFPAKIKRTALTSASSPYTELAADSYIEANCSGGAITINLRAAATAGAGKVILVKLTDATNTCTIDPNSSETAEGANTIVLTEANEVCCLICDASNWKKVFHYSPSVFAHTITAKTSNFTVLARQCNGQNTFTNTGASGEVNFTLPTAVAGYKVNFIVNAAQYLKVTAAGTSTFRWIGNQSAAGGYIRSNTVGHCWSIVYSGSDWVVTNLTGTLSVDA